MIKVTCSDTAVEKEICQLVAEGNWEGVRETQELAHDCGILVVLAEEIPTTPELSQAGRSRKTIVRDEARRKARVEDRKEQPTLLLLKNKFVEALLNHPAAQSAMEKAALIQIHALRRQAEEMPDRKEMLSIAIEAIRSLGPMQPGSIRSILYGTKGSAR